MKKKLATAAGLFSLLLSKNPAHCHVQESNSPSANQVQLPSSFIIDRPFIRFFTSLKFKTADGDIVTGKIVKLSDSKLGFASWNNEGNLIGTASLYTLLPSKDQLYVIRDPQEHVIAYLRVMDVSLWRLFKPVSTLLYGHDGTGLLKSIYSPCGFSFKVYDLRNDYPQVPSLVAHKCWLGNIEVQVNHALNIDVLAAVLLLQMQANKTVFESPCDYLHMHFPINEEDLEHFTMTSYAKGVYHPEGYVEKALPVSLDAWKELHNYLKVGTPECVLSDEQKITIVEGLAARFESPEGNASPEQLIEHLSELAEEEKAVLLELIENRL